MYTNAVLQEQERIAFLLERDGSITAREWVVQTLGIYSEAIKNPHSHASLPQYKPGFDASIKVFEGWLNDATA